MTRKLAPYEAVASLYRDKIKSGELRAGDWMPSHREASETHGVVRDTIGKAYKLLASEGLIDLKPTLRSVVLDVSHRHFTVEDRAAAMRETGQALAKGESSEILSVGMIPAPPEVRRRFGIPGDAEVLHRKRVTFKAGRPAAMSISHYTEDVAELTPELAVPQSIPYGSRELACDRMGSPQVYPPKYDVTARPQNDEELQWLDLPDDMWVLEVWRTVYVEDGRIVEVAVKTSRADEPVSFG